MINDQLNLARKWRPQCFDEIVGQNIPIKMLKNSIFVQKLFPVYLFAGQRGCGKTTTARIFAAALNCHELNTFQKDPKVSIPCLSCTSCAAMQQGSHPDFIEIDAASHTGVDNVRQIIEGSSYIPLSGVKKIYLIDEAHMLSKAAFNAFLKVLEEPPETVHFILATTESHKIPQTVLSRCFHLVFNAIESSELADYLKQLCTKENIVIDHSALSLIVAETQGSARDALNLIEQVRFSSDRINEEVVLRILGKVSVTIIIQMFEHIINNQAAKLALLLKQTFEKNILPQTTWNMFVELCRVILWLKHGIEELPHSFSKHFDVLLHLATQCPLSRLQVIMQFLWEQESLFLQTKQKQVLLEHTLIQLCYQYESNSFTAKIDSHNTPTSSTPPQSHTSTETNKTIHKQSDSHDSPAQESDSSLWGKFIQEIQKVLKDQLLLSILVQAKLVTINQESLTISLTNNGSFFKDKLSDSTTTWQPIITKYFPNFKSFDFLDNTSKKNSKPVFVQEQKVTNRTLQEPVSRHQNTIAKRKSQLKAQSSEQFSPINTSDQEKWPLSALIAKHFPGKIVKIRQ